MNKALSLASSCLNTIQRTNGTGGIITATKKITSSGVECSSAN